MGVRRYRTSARIAHQDQQVRQDEEAAEQPTPSCLYVFCCCLPLSAATARAKGGRQDRVMPGVPNVPAEPLRPLQLLTPVRRYSQATPQQELHTQAAPTRQTKAPRG